MATKKTTTKKAATKKTTTKTTASAPSTGGARKPNYQIDADASSALTKRNSEFVTFDANTTTTLRVVPPLDGSGLLFTKLRLHYQILAETGERKMAPACLEYHGDGQCYICDFIRWAKEQPDGIVQKIAEEIRASEYVYVQCYVFDVASKTWHGPKLAKFTPNTGSQMSVMLQTARDNGMPMFPDPDQGQSITVNRKGSGKNDTRYLVQPTGFQVPLDKVDPRWEKNCAKSVFEKLAPTIYNIDDQKRALHRTFPDLPWDRIQKAIG